MNSVLLIIAGAVGYFVMGGVTAGLLMIAEDDDRLFDDLELAIPCVIFWPVVMLFMLAGAIGTVTVRIAKAVRSSIKLPKAQAR